LVFLSGLTFLYLFANVLGFTLAVEITFGVEGISKFRSIYVQNP
jgi:hypothetical protein